MKQKTKIKEKIDEILNSISRCEMELDILATKTENLDEESNSIPIICLDALVILRKLIDEKKDK